MTAQRIACIFLLCFVIFVGIASATDEECFTASANSHENSQMIREEAADMGWIVSKPASLSAASYARSLVQRHPDEKVKVCLWENGNYLYISTWAESQDLKKVKGVKLYAKRKPE